MFVIKDSVHVRAPIQRCFLLSTSLEIVERELGMHPVATADTTRTAGLVLGGDRIRWEGWQLGLRHYHVSLISGFTPYSFFQDTMIAGRFKYFRHDHELTEIGGQTLMKDTIRFSLPGGFAGRLVGKYIVLPHIRGLLSRRLQLLKGIAESDQWRKYLPAEHAAISA
jgi:ligand-binding SRPBCC domain-containing protein